MLVKVSVQDGMQLVQIPQEFKLTEQDYEILQLGTALIIRPVSTQKLTQLMSCFASFTPDFMTNGRAEQGEQQRDVL